MAKYDSRPTGKLKDAVTYAKKQKAHLSAFLENSEIEISNNQVENAIRPHSHSGINRHAQDIALDDSGVFSQPLIICDALIGWPSDDREAMLLTKLVTEDRNHFSQAPYIPEFPRAIQRSRAKGDVIIKLYLSRRFSNFK